MAAPAGYYSTTPTAEARKAARKREEMDEREVERVARSAAESVYGVAAIVGPGWLERLAMRLNLGRRGISVSLAPELEIALDLRVAPGVPHQQVAANVAEKVRYIVERDFATPITELVVRVDGRVVGTVDPPGGAGRRPRGTQCPRR